MAGQPPEPSYQPNGQEQAMTQGRPAWQQPPAYTPPGGATGSQGYPAPAPAYGSQEQAYPPPEQAYPSQDQGYPAQEQTVTSLAQGQNYQGYQGYQAAYQGYGAQPGQGAATPPPQWQASPGAQPAAAKAKTRSGKGLVGSLFDFSFSSMVTPKIIKALYILFTIWTTLAAIGILVFFIDFGGLQGALAAIIIVDPIFILLSLGVYRIILEAFMVLFQIHGELKTIREQGEKRA
jgi:hypothetical protein